MARAGGAALALGGLIWAGAASAAPPAPVCIPGTPYCASSDGRGGVVLQGGAQVSPNGASAWGNSGGNANGAGGVAGWRPPPPPPRAPAARGPFGVGVAGCGAGRAGLWSGFKGGGCAGVSFRFASLAFEMETQLLYGGTTHAFDWSFPMSFLIPLGEHRSLFEGLYLRVGASPIGATFAKHADGGGFVRFGALAGAGYELRLGDVLTWRVVDARVSFDLGTKRAADRLGHFYDPGLQLATGLVF